MRLLSFYAGIIQFIISLFQLGKAFNWLPDYFISAFISGVSFHVITSQVFHMFGIDKKGFHDWLCVSTYQIRHFFAEICQFKNPAKISKTGPFGLFHYWYQLCAHIGTSNIISGEYKFEIPVQRHNSVVVALSCLTILIPTKVLSKMYAKQLKNIPIPGELFIVFVTTLLFSFYQPDGYISGKSAKLDCCIWFGFDFLGVRLRYSV